MDIDNLYVLVVFEVLAQLCDVDVHGTGVEIIVVDPDGFECVVALQHFVHVNAEQAEQFALLGGEFRYLLAAREGLLLRVEGETTHFVDHAVARLLSAHAAQNGFDAEGEFFHGEGLCEIVVGTYAEAFEDVFLERFGGEEDEGHFVVDLADVLSEGEAVFLRHHHVEHAEVVLSFAESAEACLAVGIEFGVVAFCLQIFAEQHTEVFVVFAEQDAHLFVVEVRFHNRFEFKS